MSINIFLTMKYTEENKDSDTHNASDELRSEKPTSSQTYIILFSVFAVIFFLSQEQRYHRVGMYVASVVTLLLIVRFVAGHYFSTRKN